MQQEPVEIERDTTSRLTGRCLVFLRVDKHDVIPFRAVFVGGGVRMAVGMVMFRIGIMINVVMPVAQPLRLCECGGQVEMRASRDSQARRDKGLEQNGDHEEERQSAQAMATKQRRYSIHRVRKGEVGIGH